MKSPTETMWEEILNETQVFKRQNYQLRFGQSLMNVLYKLYPDIYNQLAATDVDPFYDDRKLSSLKEAFWDIVEAGRGTV